MIYSEVAYSPDLYPHLSTYSFIIPNIVPKDAYFRHQYYIEVEPIRWEGEIFIYFERHNRFKTDTNVTIITDIVEVNDKKDSRLTSYSSVFFYSFFIAFSLIQRLQQKHGEKDWKLQNQPNIL